VLITSHDTQFSQSFAGKGVLLLMEKTLALVDTAHRTNTKPKVQIVRASVPPHQADVSHAKQLCKSSNANIIISQSITAPQTCIHPARRLQSASSG
jgi:hypothetical protein